MSILALPRELLPIIAAFATDESLPDQELHKIWTLKNLAFALGSRTFCAVAQAQNLLRNEIRERERAMQQLMLRKCETEKSTWGDPGYGPGDGDFFSIHVNYGFVARYYWRLGMFQGERYILRVDTGFIADELAKKFMIITNRDSYNVTDEHRPLAERLLTHPDAAFQLERDRCHVREHIVPDRAVPALYALTPESAGEPVHVNTPFEWFCTPFEWFCMPHEALRCACPYCWYCHPLQARAFWGVHERHAATVDYMCKEETIKFRDERWRDNWDRWKKRIQRKIC